MITDKNLVFFLGGSDLEMKEISRVLTENNQETVDLGLAWGASVASYTAQIAACKAQGKTPVLIELLEAELVQGAIVIDHHDLHAHKPASILQILAILGKEPTREQRLIAANDSAFWEGMVVGEGASLEEAILIRKKDWAAQGISEEQIAACLIAANSAKEIAPKLWVAELPHSKTAPCIDFLTQRHGLMGTNFLVISSNSEGECTEINLSGNGLLCKELWEQAKKIKGGAEWGGNPNFGTDSICPAYAGCVGKQGVNKYWALNLIIKAQNRPTILNTSILTDFGNYSYAPLTIAEAKELISHGFESAVGHQSTCDVLESLLGAKVPMNRVQFAQKAGQKALVFKLKEQVKEGVVLSAAEIEAIGYEFGLLTKH